MSVHPGAVFQYRKGPEVLLARVAQAKGEKVAAVGEDGRRVELAEDRVLQWAGELPDGATDAEVGARLREMRAEAEARVEGVDLALLWDLVKGEPEGASVAGLVETYHGRSGTTAERLAFGLALCRDRIHFKQRGERFAPRGADEVRAALERRERERLAAERRSAFIAWVRESVGRAPGGGAVPPRAAGPAPEGTADLLAAIEDLAVRADQAAEGTRARALLKELGLSFAPATPEGAFRLLVRLGVFVEDENLALRRSGIPAAFAPSLLAAAAAVPPYRHAPETDPLFARRRDLRALAAVTVDDAETRDRDDAVSLEALPEGGFRLGIHIADAAHFIAPGTALDDEALRRGTTVYLPRGKLPMVPPSLSEGLISLEAGEDRPALSFLYVLRPDLSIAGEEIAPSVVRVARNLAYEQVDRALAGEADPPLEGLPAIRDLARKRLEARIEAGATPIATPEFKVQVDPRGQVTVKRIEARSPAREMVAELMILANRTAARFCRDRAIPAIYRRQARPAEPIPDPARFASPEVYAFEARRLFQRTELGPTPGPHAALGLDVYLQATSPIRRYPDLAVERQIRAVLAGEPPPYGLEDIVRIAGSAEASAVETLAVERETTQYWLLRHLEPRRGAEAEGVVLFARDGRCLVELHETGLRTLVKARRPWAPGERVRLRIDDVRPRSGELHLSPVP